MKNKLLVSKASPNLIGFIALLMLLIPSLGWSHYSGSGTFTKITSISDLTNEFDKVVYNISLGINNTNDLNDCLSQVSIFYRRKSIINKIDEVIICEIKSPNVKSIICNESLIKFRSKKGKSFFLNKEEVASL